MKRKLTGNLFAVLTGIILSVAVFTGTPMISMAYTQTTGIVSADAAKVRKEPTTSSDVVVGLLKGSTVMVTDEVTDSAGMLWYKVSMDNGTGYIRSDLLIKATTSTGTTASATETSTQTAAPATQQTETATKKPAATTATPIAETKAYINYESARIREGASTSHEIEGSATKNTVVTITGEANGSDGKKWYQIKYTTAGGAEIAGFVRADLVTIGEPPAQAPAEPQQPAAEPEPEVQTEPAAEGDNTEVAPTEGTAEESAEAPVEPDVPAETEPETKPDYEMIYAPNNEGVEEWYLYDNINGTRQTLAGLQAAAAAGVEAGEKDVKQISTQKVIIIVLAVAVAILVVVVTLLLFKIKDFYEEDYDEEDDEDEEDEDEEEEAPVKKRRAAVPVKTVKPAKTESIKPVRPTAKEIFEEDDEDTEEAIQTPPARRKSKNFLIDDDEFEFEFLNMEDKE